jgi:tetratricopeptide (TPR) repeat protein
LESLTARSADTERRWHFAVAADSEQDGHPFAVLWHLDHLLASTAGDPRLLLPRRAKAHWSLGHWEHAIADYTSLIETNPDPESAELYLWTNRALLRLQTKDLEGYRADCLEILHHLESRADIDLTLAVNLARTCVLIPRAVPDPTRVVHLAERAVADPSDNSFAHYPRLRTLGAALIRAGRYEEAILRLNEAIKADQRRNGGEPFEWLFLALAQHHLGHDSRAVDQLAKATTWINRAESGLLTDTEPGIPRWIFNIQRDRILIELRTLRNEAEALIQKAKSELPENVFAK